MPKGKTALKYRMPVQKYIRVGDREYVFVPRANISLAWVEDQDVDFILRKKKSCCGGSKPIFFRANPSDIRRWTNNGGR
jgi:hypothetical protein